MLVYHGYTNANNIGPWNIPITGNSEVIVIGILDGEETFCRIFAYLGQKLTLVNPWYTNTE